MIKIKDNSAIIAECSNQIPNVLSIVKDKTMEELASDGIFLLPSLLEDSSDLSKEQKIIVSNGEKLFSSNILGVIGYKNEILKIESRFSDSDYFIRYTLSKIFSFPNITDFDTPISDDDFSFNMLIFLFPKYLKLALRKGLYKEYVVNEYNDRYLKGKIDLSKQLKFNTPFIGKFSYIKREQTYDNLLTELIRHTIEYISNFPFGKKILSKYRQEVRLIKNATNNYSKNNLEKIIKQNKRKPINHPYYKEYRILQKICLLILQNRGKDLGDGTQYAKGYLFDGSWLWEEYVSSIINEYFYHPRNKKKQQKQMLFTDTNLHMLGEIYPDFIGKQDVAPLCVGDAKYKPSENICSKDYLQLLAYMFRFNCNIGFYFYPRSNNVPEDKILHINKGNSFDRNVDYDITKNVIKLGFDIPKKYDSFDDFCMQMENEEMKFVNKIIHYGNIIIEDETKKYVAQGKE